MMRDESREGHRPQLLRAVARFVERASRCPGVLRIALVGSLTTEKAAPRDADVLVTVEDGADLATLAQMGRRLKGAAQSLNLGADIFLASPGGEYLGRTCNWKLCGPGVRVACRADRCGHRAFLNNDLHLVKLDRDLVEHPPIDLWPAVVRRVSVPVDVEELVIAACLQPDRSVAG